MKHEAPGKHIKSWLKVQKISITQASKDLGIGRQALSNFLNSNYNRGLSISLATKLEDVYGFGRYYLLIMQLKHDIEKFDTQRRKN